MVATQQHRRTAQRASQHEREKRPSDARAAQVWDELAQALQDLVHAHGQWRYPPIGLLERVWPKDRSTGLGAFYGSGSKPELYELYINGIADTPRISYLPRHHPHRRATAPAIRPTRMERPSLPCRNLPTPLRTPKCPTPTPLPSRGLRPSRQCHCPAPAKRNSTALSSRCATIAASSSNMSQTATPLAAARISTTTQGGKLTSATCPRFQEQQATSYRRLHQSLPALAALLLYAAGLFVLANRLFARYNAA